MKLGPFSLSCNAFCRVWSMSIVVVRLIIPQARDIDELEDERPSSHDATATRKEISPNDVLENRGFSGRL
jgi:hypothetical protein